jgi:hypothetical protein
MPARYILKSVLTDLEGMITSEDWYAIADIIEEQGRGSRPSEEILRKIVGYTVLEWHYTSEFSCFSDGAYQRYIIMPTNHLGVEFLLRVAELSTEPYWVYNTFVRTPESQQDHAVYGSIEEAQQAAQQIDNESITIQDRAWIVANAYGLSTKSLGRLFRR